MDIGEFLSYRRKQLGLSLSDVGNVVGCTPQAIYRYEKGIVKIDISLVGSFCHILDLSLESFFKMDPNFIEPRQGVEEFSQENFCAILKQEFSKDTLLSIKIASKLSTSLARVEKWANGLSLPSVGEFLILSENIGYTPADLYLGKPKKKKITPHTKWKLPLIGLVSCLIVSACISLPIVLYQPARIDEQNDSASSSLPSIKKCNVVIQGYDVDDNAQIASIHYEYKVNQGDTIRPLEINSPYYDYVRSYLGEDEFIFANTRIEKDATIKALFSKKTFNVTFLGYRDEVLAVSETRYLSDAIPPTSVEDQGDFRFIGWKEDFTNVTRNLTIHSLFSRFRSNLILDFDGGENDGKTSEEVLGYTSDLYDFLPKPQKRGHKFMGYFDQNGIQFDKQYKLDDDTITLHATYKPLIYQIHLEGVGTQDVAFGTEVSSLPLLDKNGDIVIGWKNGDKQIKLPFIYEDDFDITLSPILASNSFSYDLEEGKVKINRIKEWDSNEIDLSYLGPYPISKISSYALSENSSIESIILNQKEVELESACFDNLPSLKKVCFNNVDSSSVFHEGIFHDCQNVTYLRSGTPMKNELSLLKLKEYGIQDGSNLTFEFNESTKTFPVSWNEDFETLGELRMGEGIQGEVTVRSNGCKILHFVPGKVGYTMMTLELPDINQEELRFYGTSLVKIEGEKFGKIKRFVMCNGGVSVSNRSKPFEVEEFDISSGRIAALRDQCIKTNRILLSDRVYEGYFAPLNDELQVEFYGCTSIPSELSSRSPFLDEKNTHVSFHPEKRYNDDDLLEYPLMLLLDW